MSEEDASETEDILNASDTMPRFYRAPELVRFAKSEDILHIESDTFQMGLIFSNLFIGENPLKPTESKLDDLEIIFSGNNEVQSFTEPEKEIHSLISQMLDMDYRTQETPEYVLQKVVSIYSSRKK